MKKQIRNIEKNLLKNKTPKSYRHSVKIYIPFHQR